MRWIAFILLFTLFFLDVHGINCTGLDLDFTRCTDGLRLLSAEFHISNSSFAQGLIYGFNTNQGMIVNEESKGIGNPRFLEFSIKETQPGDFQIQWPNDLLVKSLKITHRDCLGSDYVSFMTYCISGEECYYDDDCEDDERCDDGLCKEFTCESCEKINEHQCVAKCDDKSPCTKDTCSEGICHYENIENCCEADLDCEDSLICTIDQCETSLNRCIHKERICPNLCKEPTGCIVLEEYNGENDAFFSGVLYRFQKAVSDNKGYSKVAFYGTLCIVLILLLVLTGIERKRRSEGQS